MNIKTCVYNIITWYMVYICNLTLVSDKMDVNCFQLPPPTPPNPCPPLFLQPLCPHTFYNRVHLRFTCQEPPAFILPRTTWDRALDFSYFQESRGGLSTPRSASGCISASHNSATGLGDLPSSPSDRNSKSCNKQNLSQKPKSATNNHLNLLCTAFEYNVPEIYVCLLDVGRYAFPVILG